MGKKGKEEQDEAKKEEEEKLSEEEKKDLEELLEQLEKETAQETNATKGARGSFTIPKLTLAAPVSSHVISKPRVSLPQEPLQERKNLEEEIEKEQETNTKKDDEEQEFSYDAKNEQQEILYDARTKKRGGDEGINPNEMYQGKPSEQYHTQRNGGEPTGLEQGGRAQEYLGREQASTKTQAWVVGQRSEAKTQETHWQDTHRRIEGETIKGTTEEEGFVAQGRKAKKYD